MIDHGYLCREQGRLRGRHEPTHDGASRGEPSNVGCALSRSGATGVAEWLCPRPRQGHDLAFSGGMLSASDQTVVPMVGSKSSPDFNMACIVTASLRAKAVAARLKPTRSLSFSPHVRKPLSA